VTGDKDTELEKEKGNETVLDVFRTGKMIRRKHFAAFDMDYDGAPAGKTVKFDQVLTKRTEFSALRMN